MPPLARKCFECRSPIEECNGSTHAGDFMLAAEGKISFALVRERCGRCVERILLREETAVC